MFGRFSSWFSRRSDEQTGEKDGDLPFPATEKPRWRPRELRLASSISRPISRTAPVTVDNGDQPTHPYSQNGPTQFAPPNANWLESGSTESVDDRTESSLSVGPWPVPPAVIRVSSESNNVYIPQTPGRPVSFPPSSASYDSTSSTSSTPRNLPPRPESRASHRISGHTRNSTSSRDSQPSITVSTDVYGSAYNYPLAKQLSPIQEQDYATPTSFRKSIKLPSVSGRTGSNLSIAPSVGSYTSYAGSQKSEITRTSFSLVFLI
jgi:hypothetical protein